MLEDGTMIGCRYCSQCVGRAVDDWTGRCIAESIFAVAPYFLSLTYGRELDEDGEQVGSEDHIRARLLTYSDIQKLMKRFRASGYIPRYFCVGEYGSAKGRAHWHVLIFWRDNSAQIAHRIEHNELVRARLKRGKTLNVPDGPVPPHVNSTRDDQKRHMQEHWKHGWSVWERIGVTPEDTAAAVRYVCKYLNKDLGGEEKQAMCRMSKFPLLGADWLHDKAARHVEAGIPPVDLFYEFPGVNRPNGERVPFMLRPYSAAADLFCQSFLDQWAEAYECEPVRVARTIERGPKGKKKLVTEHFIVTFTGRGHPPPPSDLIEEYGDRIARSALEAEKWLVVEAKKEAERDASAARQRQLAARHMPGTNYDWDTQRFPSIHGPAPLLPPKPIADTPPPWGGLE